MINYLRTCLVGCVLAIERFLIIHSCAVILFQNVFWNKHSTEGLLILPYYI